MSPRADRLFREYAESHRDPVNVAIHKVAVPAILFHVVAMLDWIGTGLSVAGLDLTAGVIVTALAAIWYAVVTRGSRSPWCPSRSCASGSAALARDLVIAVAAAAWIAQLIGHARFERRAPAFKDNLVQLLVGPAYVARSSSGRGRGVRRFDPWPRPI